MLVALIDKSEVRDLRKVLEPALSALAHICAMPTSGSLVLWCLVCEHLLPFIDGDTEATEVEGIVRDVGGIRVCTGARTQVL